MNVLGRAVLPVVGGIAVLAAIFAATLGIAAWNARGGGEPTTRLAPRELPVGNVESVAKTIAETGPILFPGLNTTTGRRTIVLAHQGDDPTRGWRVYLAHPADADATCAVTQIRGTDRFTDCHGTELSVSELARPADACPIIEQRQRISIGLVADVCG
jgi:hypothetical protein